MSLIDALFLDSAPLNIWLAWRTDGVKGSGTHSDPYDASTKLAAADAASLSQANSNDLREITISISDAHLYSDGDLVLVSGDDSALYNGAFAIYGKSVPDNSFKIQIPIHGPAPNGSHTVARVSAGSLRFDDVMNSLPANCRVHLGPTPVGNPFLTNGYAADQRTRRSPP